MKFSGKMCFKIILKVTKNQGFTLSLEDTFFEKPQRERGRVKLTPPVVLGLRLQCYVALLRLIWINARTAVHDRVPENIFVYGSGEFLFAIVLIVL